MKRLQLRHHSETFQNRGLALQFFANLINPEHTASTVFNGTLFAEPMVAEYFDEEGNRQVILAIGKSKVPTSDIVRSANLGAGNDELSRLSYHLIDTGLLNNQISKLGKGEDELREILEGLSSDLENTNANAAEIAEALSSLSGVVETALENISSEVSGDISALSGSVLNEISALSESVDNRFSEVNSSIEYISATTKTIEDRLSESSSQASSDLNTAKQELVDLIGTTSAETLSQANRYTDAEIEESNAANIREIVYNPTRKTIQLRKGDGTLTEGIDVGDFVKDSVLSRVEFDEGNNALVFVWDDDDTTRMSIPLTKFATVYSVDEDSVTFLKMKDNKFCAVVDEASGYVRTLATTTYVKDKMNEAVEQAVEQAAIATSANTRAIEILNGNKNVDGSVRHIIDDKFSKDILTAGTPVTTVTLEEARSHSLLRKLVIDGEEKYYASSDANDMQYTTSTGTKVNLNQYITQLEGRVSELEGKVTELEAKDAELEGKITELQGANDELSDRIEEVEQMIPTQDDIKNLVASLLAGVDKEIKVSYNGTNKISIGFADDAVFGDYLANPE